MALPRSPLAPAQLPPLEPVAGVRLATAQSGIRYKGRSDLLLVELAEGSTGAGVFTRSLAAAAPIDWCKAQLAQQAPRAVLVNAGNANAFTGRAGMAAVEACANATAHALGIAPGQVMIASTGVIGEPLPSFKITDLLPQLAGNLRAENWDDAPAAILTTDTFKKTARATCLIDSVPVTIQGFAKGSGMIAPDMATMLGFLFTDAAVAAPVLKQLLQETNETSFNAITVDSDTSTNDCALLFATGQAKHTPIMAMDDARLPAFRDALQRVMTELALMIVRDGEGASKLIEITIEGAESPAAAKRLALSVANSPLVKTAIAGQDANWGRIVAAIGKAGERADRDKLKVWIGGVLVAAEGAVHPDYREAQIIDHMRGQEITIRVDVGVGAASFTAYSCDFTEGYIKINGSYRS